MDRKRRWFDEGAVKFRMLLEHASMVHLLPEQEPIYPCPSCLNAYGWSNAGNTLSEEHVPPLSVGGKAIILTCTKCNNTAGTLVDSQAAKKRSFDDFRRIRVTGEQFTVEARAGNRLIRGTAEWTETGLQVFGVPKQNNPIEWDDFFRSMDDLAQTGTANPDVEFTVSLRYDPLKANVSWLRSGYLAAFAAMGWRYTYREIMAPIRYQIAQPSAEITTGLVQQVPASAVDTRIIQIVDSPEDLRSILIAIGDHVVFLPGLDSALTGYQPQTCQDLAATIADRLESGDLTEICLVGKKIEWPTQATYFFDPS